MDPVPSLQAQRGLHLRGRSFLADADEVGQQRGWRKFWKIVVNSGRYLTEASASTPQCNLAVARREFRKFLGLIPK